MLFKRLYLGFISFIIFYIAMGSYLHVSATPNVSLFTNAGITYSTVVGGDYNGYKIVDSIEKLYMIRYGLTDNYLITRDLDFQNTNSYINPSLNGDFNGDGTASSILTEMTTGSGWLPIGMNPNGTVTSPYIFSGDLIGSGLIEINNLIMNRTLLRDGQGLGIFIRVSNNTIENLAFTNVDFDIYSINGLTSNPQVAVLTSTSDSLLLRKVFIEGQLDISADTLPSIRVGGLISQSTNNLHTIDIEETIVNLEITVNPTSYAGASNTFIGGFIGHHVSMVNIFNSAFIGSIDSGSPIGGMVADSNASSSNTLRIVNSYVNATLTNRGGLSSIKGMGGLIAQVSAGGRDLDIANTYTTGELVQIHAGDKRYTAGLLGADNVGSEHDRLFRNVLVAMSNDATKYKAFGFPWLGTTPNIRASEVTNSYIINDITISGVEVSEANVIGVVNTLNEAFSSGFQQSVIGSGSNVWSFEDNRMPLLYYSGTTTLMPFQTFRILRNGQLSTATSVNVIFNTNSNSGLITQQSITGNSITALDVSKVGHELEGWYTDVNLTNLYDFNTLLSSDLTLYAKWILTTFTITLDSLGGSIVGSVSGNEGDVIGLPIPTLKDYRFDGWLNNQGQLVANPYTVKNVNETFTAKWTFVTFSPITVIPLERTYFLDINETTVIEFGEELILPDYDAYEMYGRIKTDLSEYVTITGEIGPNPGEYPITYTLTYEDTVIIEEVIVTVVDNTPPTLIIDIPSSVFYKNETTPVITATDNAPGAVTVSAVKELDVMRPGVQLVIYDAVDASGNLTRVIQEVSVVMPDVRYETVMVNAQRLTFVLYEHLIDSTTMVLYMAQSIIEPPITSSAWEVYEEREFIATGPGERVYLQMRDALGNILSRESIELFWSENQEFTPRRILGEVVYPEVEPSYYIPWPLVGGISVGSISLGGLFLWFIKRRNNEKE